MRHQLWRIKWIKWFWKRCRDNLGRYREHFLAVRTELLGDFFDELKFQYPNISEWFCYENAEPGEFSCRELSHITRKGLQHSIVPIFVNVKICQLMQLLSLSEKALWLSFWSINEWVVTILVCRKSKVWSKFVWVSAAFCLFSAISPLEYCIFVDWALISI